VTFRDCGAAVFQRVALALAVGDVTNRPYHCGKTLANRRGLIIAEATTAKAVSITYHRRLLPRHLPSAMP
jgi:hypothetical protein